MEFTLIYRGQLPPTGNSNKRSKPKAKQDIRDELHPQLSKVLVEHPMGPDLGDTAEAQARGHTFAALFGEHNKMVVDLDIELFMRYPPRGHVQSRTDIDNRIKTLFDGLQRPQSDQEVPTDWAKPGGTDRLYVLVDNDNRIREYRIRPERLFTPQPAGGSRSEEANDVEAIIRVRSVAIESTWIAVRTNS